MGEVLLHRRNYCPLRFDLPADVARVVDDLLGIGNGRLLYYVHDVYNMYRRGDDGGRSGKLVLAATAETDTMVKKKLNKNTVRIIYIYFDKALAI